MMYSETYPTATASQCAAASASSKPGASRAGSARQSESTSASGSAPELGKVAPIHTTTRETRSRRFRRKSASSSEMSTWLSPMCAAQ